MSGWKRHTRAEKLIFVGICLLALAALAVMGILVAPNGGGCA